MNENNFSRINKRINLPILTQSKRLLQTRNGLLQILAMRKRKTFHERMSAYTGIQWNKWKLWLEFDLRDQLQTRTARRSERRVYLSSRTGWSGLWRLSRAKVVSINQTVEEEALKTNFFLYPFTPKIPRQRLQTILHLSARPERQTYSSSEFVCLRTCVQQWEQKLRASRKSSPVVSQKKTNLWTLMGYRYEKAFQELGNNCFQLFFPIVAKITTQRRTKIRKNITEDRRLFVWRLKQQTNRKSLIAMISWT